MADELTATLAGLLCYIGVLALLGVAVIHILELDEVVGTAIESTPRSAVMTVARPMVVDDTTLPPSHGSARPTLRTGVTAK